MRLFNSWQHTLQGLGVDQVAIEQAFTDLVKAYSTGDRHYHTLNHIHHVLSVINTLQAYTHDLKAVQLAAWFHDVIYNTQAQDNEEESAEYACQMLSDLGVSSSIITKVACLIINTKHYQSPTDDDSQVLLDADLAILATNPDQYQKYACAIRQEYAWVKESEYITGRRQVLESFLHKQQIYYTPLMFEIAEQAARVNLLAEIQTLNLSHEQSHSVKPYGSLGLHS
jgi:predicted metal-dependent HD superfamily phosphohydrolase